MSKQESVESDISESLLSPRPSRRESVASVSQVQDSSSQDSLGSMCEMKATVELHKDLRIGGSMERDLTVSSLETKPDPNFVVKVEAKCSGSSSSSSDSLSKVLTPPSAGGIKTELKFEEHHVSAQVNGLQSAKTVKDEVCTEDKSVCECSESENTNVKSNCAVEGSSSEPPCGSVDSMSAPPRTSDTSSVSTDSDRTCECEVSQTCESDRLTQEVGDTSCDVSTGAKRPLESGSESAACSSSAAAASSWAVPSHSVILPDEGCSSDCVKPVAVDGDGEVSESVSRRNSQEVREEDDNMKVDSAGEIAHGRDLMMEVVPSVSNVSSGRVDSSQSQQEKSKESSDETAASSSDSSIPSAQPQHHIETDNADAVVDSGTNSVFERGKSSEKDSIEISSSNEVSGVRTLQQQQQQGESSSSSSSSSTAAVLESEQEVDSTAVATTSHSDSALLDAKVDSTCTEQMECTERTDSSSSSSSAVSSSAKPLNILPQLDTTSCESAEAEAISPVTPPVVIVSTISSSPSSLAQVSSAISSSSGGGGSGSSSSHSSCGASTNHNSDPVSSSSLNLMAAATMVPLLCTNTCVNTSAATVAAAATSAAAAATTTTTPPTPPIKKKVSLRHDSLFLLLEGGKENAGMPRVVPLL